MTARIEKASLWIRRWWGPITGTWLIGVSIALLALAFATYSTQSDQEQLGRNIQTERAESIRINCYEQNSRNTKALEQLRFAPIEVRRFAAPLVDALAPVRDCVELADKRVRAR